MHHGERREPQTERAHDDEIPDLLLVEEVGDEPGQQYAENREHGTDGRRQPEDCGAVALVDRRALNQRGAERGIGENESERCHEERHSCDAVVRRGEETRQYDDDDQMRHARNGSG